MFCPKCEYEKTKVTMVENSYSVERCRKCPDCGYSWLTIETIKNDKEISQLASISIQDAQERKKDKRFKGSKTT